MTKRITLALPAMIALLSACASTPTIPDHLLNPAAHPKFPPSAYITSVGMSERGPREAELDARARVAEQVRSEIESVTLSEIEEVTKGGSTEAFQRLYSEVKSRTGFSHAEMIRVEPAPAKGFEGLYRAFAYLSRAEIFDVLCSDYEAEAVAFRRAADVLPALDNIAAYTAAFRQAKSSFQTLRAKAFEIRAVTRRQYADYGRDEKLYYNLDKMRLDRLRELEMTVEISGEKAGSTREVVLVALTTALTRLGLTATPGACGPRSYTLKVEVDVTCRRGSFGPQCEIGMAGVLVHCASGRVLAELDLNDKEFKGMHTRDRAKAMEAMYERVTANLLLPRLSAGLATALPIDRVN